MLYGPIFVADVEKDLELVEQIFRKDYSTAGAPIAGQAGLLKRPAARSSAPNGRWAA